MQNHITAGYANKQPAFQYLVPTVSNCPICGGKPVLLWINGEYQYECGSDTCRHGVYEYAERFAPEAEYPLEACRDQSAALDDWNRCVSFYVANSGRSPEALSAGMDFA